MSDNPELLGKDPASIRPKDILSENELAIFNHKYVTDSLKNAETSCFEDLQSRFSQLSSEDHKITTSLVGNLDSIRLASQEFFTLQQNRFQLKLTVQKMHLVDDPEDGSIVLGVVVYKTDQEKALLARNISFMQNPDAKNKTVTINSSVTSQEQNQHIATPIIYTDHYLKRAIMNIFPDFFSGKPVIGIITDEAVDKNNNPTMWSTHRATTLGYTPKGKNSKGVDYFIYKYQ